MSVIYILEQNMYYQWKELKRTIPTIPNTKNRPKPTYRV